MAECNIFAGPQCLIYTDPRSNTLAINDEVLDDIAADDKQLNVVAITGLFRTGKSYLLNRLAGRSSGFPLGSTVEAKTKGIWSWKLDHPINEDQTLLLLDTEGLGDIRKGDEKHDNQIFTLATLLCSTLIYNMFGAFDQDALNKLRFITELAKNIRIKETDDAEDDSSFDVYFPVFILALRDWSLELQIDGEDITPDEYLEHCLNALPGTSKEVQRFNEPRLCIRKYFKTRKCFVFDRPAHAREKLARLDTLRDDELSPEFKEDARRFVDFVLRSGRGMTLTDKSPVNGRMFASLVNYYVDQMGNGAVPCIMNAVQIMTKVENERAVTVSLELYKTNMAESVDIPTEDEQELLCCHMNCKNEAMDQFRKICVMDTSQEHMIDLDGRIQIEYEGFAKENARVSSKRCQELLRQLQGCITAKLTNNEYAVPGGYDVYKEDAEYIKQQYYSTPGLGVMRTKVYLAYIQTRQTEEQTVMGLDRSLTELERERERQEIQRKMAEERENHAREMNEQLKKEMETIRTQYDMDYAMQLSRDEENMLKERETMAQLSEQRLAEIRRLHNEGLEELSRRQEQELANLREEVKNRQDMQNQRPQFERHYEGQVRAYQQQRQPPSANQIAQQQWYQAIVQVVGGVKFIQEIFSTFSRRY